MNARTEATSTSRRIPSPTPTQIRAWTNSADEVPVVVSCICTFTSQHAKGRGSSTEATFKTKQSVDENNSEF